FTYSYYLNILLNKISRNWHNPFRGQNVVMKSIVYFEVDKDGNIYSVRLEDRSGNELYDETTMRAVIATKSLPPLPDEFGDDYLKVHLEFLTAQ
ncbi:MAG: TonB C-terminal domain-containing protein, partial [candidate division WOR-3 bacterium]